MKNKFFSLLANRLQRVKETEYKLLPASLSHMDANFFPGPPLRGCGEERPLEKCCHTRSNIVSFETNVSNHLY